MVCASSKYELGIRFRMFGVDVRDTRSAVWSGCAPALGEMSPALGEMSPALGEMSPALGEKAPALGEMSPALGEMACMRASGGDRWRCGWEK